jgi:hypothetical protein
MEPGMEALFIGQTYIDVTFLTDRIPDGRREDRRTGLCGQLRRQCRIGSLLLRQARHCAGTHDLAGGRLARPACSWTWRRSTGISVHGRKVKESSLSFVMPNHGMRAIIRCRDDHYLHPVPPLDISGCRALHLDGHQAGCRDASIAKLCRDRGILTSLDGGGLRSNTLELLDHIDVAICSERLCEQLNLTPA